MGTAMLDNCAICLVWLFKFAAASIMLFSKDPPFNYVGRKKKEKKRNAASALNI